MKEIRTTIQPVSLWCRQLSHTQSVCSHQPAPFIQPVSLWCRHPSHTYSVCSHQPAPFCMPLCGADSHLMIRASVHTSLHHSACLSVVQTAVSHLECLFTPACTVQHASLGADSHLTPRVFTPACTVHSACLSGCRQPSHTQSVCSHLAWWEVGDQREGASTLKLKSSRFKFCLSHSLSKLCVL